MSNSNNNNSGGQGQGQFGDTTQTKVFVGGLAWETPMEAMRDHFLKYGHILEAVIISDKITGRSKGYGFVTFKEAEAANKACEDATPIINGRRANCNLAALGARRPPPRSSSTTPPPPPPLHPGSNGGGRPTSATTHVPPPVQWYYPAAATGGAPPAAATAPFHAPPHHQPLPFYGYSPTYIATDVSYNHKLSYNGGAYMNGHYTQMYPGSGQAMMGANTLMPIYPFYNYQQHHHSQQQAHHAAMGLPPTSVGPIITAHLPIISKPTPVSIAPPSGTVGVEES